MDKYWADKWADALTSGEFAQSTGKLFRPVEERTCQEESCQDCKINPAGYCCLGVLTEIVRREHPDTGNWNKEGRFVTDGDNWGYAEFTPPEIMKIVGINSSDPVLYSEGDTYVDRVSCSSANDTFGLSFAQIAEHVKKNYDSI